MTSLLDKAKSHKAIKSQDRKITKEEHDLALAWVDDEISVTQVAMALNCKGGAAYTRLALFLKDILRTRND